MRHFMMAFVIAGVTACGGGSTDDLASDAAASADLDPCALLTASQVEAVLPGADAGFATSRGRQLMEGVRQHQCSYTDPQANLFLVAIDVADTDERFDAIRPGNADRYVRELGAERVMVGDGGWWVQRAGGRLELRATKGRAAIHLDASVGDGPARADALVAAGNAVAAQLD